MSLVADIIASTKQGTGHNDSVIEMEKLIKQSEEARVRVCEALNSQYSSLTKILSDSQNLHSKISNCVEDIEILDCQIKDRVIPSIEGSASEIETVTARWKEIKEELKATQMLLDIHILLDEFQKEFDSMKFSNTVNNLKKIEEILKEGSCKEIESQLEIIAAVREELILRRTDVLFKVEEVWNKFISLSEEEMNDGNHGVALSILDVRSNNCKMNKENIDQALLALNSLSELKRYIKAFGKSLQRHFIKPILCEMGEVEVSHQTDYGVSVLYVRKPENPTKVNDTVSAVKALENLELIFSFLNEHLSIFVLEEDNRNMSLMTLLGDEIGEEFINLVMNNCLEESIPTDRKDLQNFNDVQKRVEEFHKFLVDIGFYGDDHKSLLNYVSNIDAVFGNKICIELLTKARNLMTKSLNVTVNIDSLSPEGPLVALDEYGKKFKETSLNLQKLSAKTFNLTKCQVSLSVCELVNLLYETLEEACVCAPDFAVKLFHAVRNILSMYRHIIPTAHSHTLPNIPEHAALIHNNGVFLAHHALLFGHHYKTRIPATTQSSASLTTADLGYMIRASGCGVFLKAMQNHKAILLDMIRKGIESTSSQCDVSSVNPLHSSVQSCLAHIRKLKSAWQNILPSSVYTKSIGTLAGSVVEDLVLRVVSFEEISTDDAIGLINVLSLLTSEIPSIFSDSDENAAAADTLKEVRFWEKLKELIVVLGASLKDLGERWSEGKGPLALHFTPEEVKHLIRAIFQNTERRAKLLAKIK